MSIEQEDFDEMFRSKLSEGDFEFNEANWDKAEALIIQADKKRKRRRIGFIFLIGLTLGVCLMIPFIGSDKKESLRNENKTNSVEKKGVEESDSKAENRDVNQATNIPAHINDRESNKQINVIQPNEAALKVISETKFQTEGKPASINSSNKSTSDNVFVSHVKKEKQEGSKGQAKKLNNNPSTTKVSDSPAHDEFKNNTSTQEQAVTKSKETKVDSVIVKTAMFSSTTNKSVVKDTAIVVKDSVATIKKDSVKSVAKETPKDDKKESLKQINVFSMDAGANYSLGWANNSVKEANGFNEILGVSIIHFFNIRWSTLLGIQYNSLAHLSYSNYSGSNTQYNFGYTTSYASITPKMLYYLAIPVKLQYWLNSKNSLSVGANVLYLLNTSSTFSTYTQTDFTTSNHTTVTKMGYMDGFSSWDIQPALAYRRRIYKSLSISAEAYYGLMDIKSNSFFGINKAEHNNGLKLVLSYSFIK